MAFFVTLCVFGDLLPLNCQLRPSLLHVLELGFFSPRPALLSAAAIVGSGRYRDPVKRARSEPWSSRIKSLHMTI